jgi:hypothetical protein
MTFDLRHLSDSDLREHAELLKLRDHPNPRVSGLATFGWIAHEELLRRGVSRTTSLPTLLAETPWAGAPRRSSEVL